MAFPDDVYQYYDDTDRQPLTYLLGLYNASRDNEYTSYRGGLFGVAVYHGDTVSSDNSFPNYMDSVAVSLGYIELSNGIYVWKV